MNDFLGKPIHGDITHYTSEQQEQHDPIEFVNLIEALLAKEHVEAVRWHQYTPYFNDGDACVFNVYGLTVKLDIFDDDEDEEGDYGDNFLDGYSLWVYGQGNSYSERENNKQFILRGIDTKEIYDAFNALESVLGHHEVILQKKFGDPAQVTFDENGFNVEFYDHD